MYNTLHNDYGYGNGNDDKKMKIEKYYYDTNINTNAHYVDNHSDIILSIMMSLVVI